MEEKKTRSKKYYRIAFLVSTSYIWFLILAAYSMGIPQYIQLLGEIALITAFTCYFSVPIFYIGLPLVYIRFVLSCFRIYTSERMLAYYALSCFVLGLALFLPLKIYGFYEENYIFTKQVHDQRIEEKIKQAIEKNNGPIQITYVTRESMLQSNEGSGSPVYPKINIHFELLNCDKQNGGGSGFSCESSVEAYYKDKKWLVDYNSKENTGVMNLSKDNQRAVEVEKQLALTPEEELNICNNAESKAIQYVKNEYNLDLTIVEKTLNKHTSSYKKENRPSNAIHALTINGYLNTDSQKDITVRVEYDPIAREYWSHIYEMSDGAKKEIEKQIELKKEIHNKK